MSVVTFIIRCRKTPPPFSFSPSSLYVTEAMPPPTRIKDHPITAGPTLKRAIYYAYKNVHFGDEYRRASKKSGDRFQDNGGPGAKRIDADVFSSALL